MIEYSWKTKTHNVGPKSQILFLGACPVGSCTMSIVRCTEYTAKFYLLNKESAFSSLELCKEFLEKELHNWLVLAGIIKEGV